MAKKKLEKVNNPERGLKLVYDVRSAPATLGVANMVKIFEQHRIIFWDSTLGGVQPKFYGVDDMELGLAIVDTTGAQIDFDQYQREYDDKMFYDKELYNCQNSPMYYWSNYGTPVYPSTIEGMREFLVSIGMSQISTDSDKAAKEWEKQKATVKEAMSFVTVEHLKERKAVISVLKAQYEKVVIGLEEKLKDKVDLFNAKGEPHPDKKRIANLVGKIKTLGAVPDKWEQYRNKKRKWDTAMLFNTNYDILLTICDELYESRVNTGKALVDSKS